MITRMENFMSVLRCMGVSFEVCVCGISLDEYYIVNQAGSKDVAYHMSCYKCNTPISSYAYFFFPYRILINPYPWLLRCSLPSFVLACGNCNQTVIFILYIVPRGSSRTITYLSDYLIC